VSDKVSSPQSSHFAQKPSPIQKRVRRRFAVADAPTGVITHRATRPLGGSGRAHSRDRRARVISALRAGTQAARALAATAR
jgi:hypothetical protein